jgi:hypothetical protein
MKNATEELFKAGIFLLTFGRTNGKVTVSLLVRKSSSWRVFEN